jgi:hypothetical protein
LAALLSVSSLLKGFNDTRDREQDFTFLVAYTIHLVTLKQFGLFTGQSERRMWHTPVMSLFSVWKLMMISSGALEPTRSNIATSH